MCDMGELRWFADCLKEVYALKDFGSFFKKLWRDNSWSNFAIVKTTMKFLELCVDG